MIEVYDRLFVGSASDFEAEVADPSTKHGIKEGGIVFQEKRMI